MIPRTAPAACPTRRDFLSTLATAAVAPLVLPAVARGATGTGATPATTTPPSGPTCVHVFSKPLGGMSYEDTARLVAEAGFGGIDYLVRGSGHIRPERVREDLPRAVAAAHAAGLKVEMITTGIISADDKHTVPVLETAAKLGIKYYRLGWMNYDFSAGVWATLTRLKPVMRQLAELNERLGIHGAYQNHSGIRVGGAGWDIHELIRDLDPRWIGCQFDIRHATAEGGQSWPVMLRLLQPWIRCTDIKDFRWVQKPGKATIEGTPLGEGIVDFAQYFKLAGELKIGGPMSVHLEYPPFEGGPENLTGQAQRKAFLEAMRKDAQALRTMMTAVRLT